MSTNQSEPAIQFIPPCQRSVVRQQMQISTTCQLKHTYVRDQHNEIIRWSFQLDPTKSFSWSVQRKRQRLIASLWYCNHLLKLQAVGSNLVGCMEHATSSLISRPAGRFHAWWYSNQRVRVEVQFMFGCFFQKMCTTVFRNFLRVRAWMHPLCLCIWCRLSIYGSIWLLSCSIQIRNWRINLYLDD